MKAKSVAVKIKTQTLHITLPGGEIITPSPGTVPTSEGSIKETDIKKMIKAAREASKAGVFDKEEDYGIYIPAPTR